MSAQLYQTCTMGELTINAISRFSDRTAIVGEDFSVTFEQMGAQISRVIQVFESLGLRRGDGIAQLSANRAEVIYVMLAAGLMGLRYTPLHPFGAEDDHNFILEDAEISLLIIDETKFSTRGTSAINSVDSIQTVLTYGPGVFGNGLIEKMSQLEPKKLTPDGNAEDIAWIAYTGGTTGRPKGVVHKHKSLVSYTLMSMADWDWPPKPKYLAVTPLSHSAGIMVPAVLLLGGSIRVEATFSPNSFLNVVQKHRITATFLVPTMIYALLDDEHINSFDISSLETIIYGAAPMSPNRLVEAIKLFGPVFMQLYGQTEAPNAITVLSKNDHKNADFNRLTSCGTPVIGNQIKLLDIDGNEVDDGEIGEICVRGPLVMDGYWKRPKETNIALQGNWLHTGDLARKDEQGYYYIVDRSKDTIISGGFNIYPREVEDVLMTHEAVSEVAIIGVPDDKWGEAVTAIIVLNPGFNACAKVLSAYVKEKKGSIYVPKQFKWVDKIPLTSLGKANKKQLREDFFI